MIKYLFILIIIFALSSCAESSQTKHNSISQEIRRVLCEIENGNYAKAQNNLEKILQQEPQNIHAQRLLPGVLAQQIKKDDKSSENVAQIRKTIKAYEQFLENPQILPEEKTSAGNFIISLYEKISDEEKVRELLKRTADTNQSPADRSRFFTMLASQSYGCAAEITLKKTKPEKSEIEKAKGCVETGLEYIDQAIALDSNNDTAWSYKASFLSSASKIAELDNELARKDLLQKQSKEATKRFADLSQKKRELLNKQDEERNEQNPAEENAFRIGDVSQELIEYKIEKSLDELIKEIYIPLEQIYLVAPKPESDETESNDKETDLTLPKNTDHQKREWKEFSPEDEEITAQLPENAAVDFSEETLIYNASSEGVSYTIISQPKPLAQNANLDDAALNTLAWSIVKPLSNFWLMGNSPGSYEIKLVRKESLGGQPSRNYSFTLGSCSGKTVGTLFVVAGRKRNYGIEIRGANEEDPRAQRFLKTLKFKTQK